MLRVSTYHEKGSDKLINKKHCHENRYEIIQTLSSDGNFVIKDALYPIEYGSVFLINGIDLHCSAPQKPNLYTRNKIILNSEILFNLAEQMGCTSIIQSMFIDTGSAVVKLDSSEIEQVDTIFQEICDLQNEGSEQNRLALYARIFQLLQICYNNHKEKKPKLDNCVSQALAYINDNITTLTGVDEVAKSCFVTESYLYRLFKNELHKTPAKYIASKRLLLAERMISDGEKPTTVYEKCGFSDYTTFYRNYRAFFGRSPSDF